MLSQVKELLEHLGFNVNYQEQYLFASMPNAAGETYQILYSRDRLSLQLKKGILSVDLLYHVKAESLEDVKFFLSREYNFSEDFKTLCAEKLQVH